MDKLKSIYASAQAATASIVFSAAVTIAAELSAPFKSWLAGITSHHWVTKSWLSILTFILVFIAFRLSSGAIDGITAKKALFRLEAAAIFGFFSILFFFIYEFF